MATEDISRFLFQPQKRYSSVRMQQGRVILDSDWNESERIDDEHSRRTLLDVLCSKGTSNQGFRVGSVRDAEVELPGPDSVVSYDFDFENGSFYIGGLRFETETNGNPETFQGQDDWLQIDALADNLPVLPQNLPVGGVRHDLVYLRGWEQCVTAIEDSELRERALGTDTSVRMRLTRRVEVLTDVPDTCAAAFNVLREKLTREAGATHEFDKRNCELKSNARITVVPNPADITDDPCKPAVPGGYLGADNQTIRVQLTASDRFIWGYDNAAPLYRVQVENIPDVPGGVDGTRRQIRFLTLPRDQVAQPLAGQAVEIIPWGALLPNQEKVAEFQGQLFTVETSFDPEDGSLTITQPVSQEWVKWLADHSQFWSDQDDPQHQQYCYLRLWTGGSGDVANPDHQFTSGTPEALQGTGLRITFSDLGLPGDFWVIAARPNTPNLVVPWELLKSAPPAGPRYFFAPLALIRWSLDESNTLRSNVRDCREKFRPLCDLRGCCTVTVGDGILSRGDFDSIEDAVANLPDDGGEVCLLLGQHQANVTLVGVRNITIKGCGKQTRVIPRESNREGPIFQVVNSRCITLRDMDLVTLGGTAVVLEGSETGDLKEISISYNRILACKQAIQVRGGMDIHIHNNRIRMLDKEVAGVAILILAEDALVEWNNIGVVPAEKTPPSDQPEDTPDPSDPCADPELVYRNPSFLPSFLDHFFGLVIAIFPVAPFKALGGIQIAAASECIKVLDNTISGGAGNGITLGGAVPDPAVPIDEDPDGEGHTIESRGKSIQGRVRLSDSSGLTGISLAFTGVGGVTRTTVTGTDGYFDVPNTEPGKYTVSLSSPGFQIKSIAPPDTSDDVGPGHIITVVRQEPPDPKDVLGFLYDIQIDRNEISHMGLSGIGFPIVVVSIPNVTLMRSAVGVKNPAIVATLALLGNPLVTIGIHRNHIHACLQTPFDGQLRTEAGRRGFGGISLGFCENVTISENRIERNGRNYINPVCGIFIRFGEQVDIHHNHILDNGPLAAVFTPSLEFGFRGGIFLSASSFGLDEVFLRQKVGFDTGRHAARIHDNIVHQPAGQALRLFAIGPASICGNRFATDLSGPEPFERLAGALLVLTLGGENRLPAGLTLFNSNQSRLGERATSLMSQIILTTDDIGFDGNQCVAITDGIDLTDTVSVFINTFLLGRTLRASDNRFKEPTGSHQQALKISLLTRTSLLNNTNDNQGDHCIFAFNTAPGRSPNVIGNQVVDSTLCPPLNNSIAVPVSRFPVRATIRGA